MRLLLVLLGLLIFLVEVRVPAFADVPYPVKMEPNLVVEFYSR